MACLITKGRLEPCKEFVGGLYKVWFVNFGLLDGYVDTAGVVDITGVTTTAFEYGLKGTSNLSQEMTSSRENGTTFVTQTLTLDLKGADASTNNEIKLLAYGRPHIFVQDNYGSVWLIGAIRGADLVSSTLATGAAMGDKYGYTLTFNGLEPIYAGQLTGSTVANWQSGITGSITVTVGT